MKILVLNSGSSSIKYKIFDFSTLKKLFSGEEENITEHTVAVKVLIDKLIKNKIINDFHDIKVVGHRVVHGGDFFDKAVLIDEKVIKIIEQLFSLAPLHNPANLAGIKAIKHHFPTISQVAVFDTSFHTTLPDCAKIYPLPYNYYKDLNIKRYGFHGISHKYIANEGAKVLQKDIKKTNLITLHLGGGCSICAIKNGKSIDTSMGFTPLEGLMMGTRCGDIDSSIIFYLKQNLKLADDKIEEILNKQSGFKGICNISDMKEIEKSYWQNNFQAKLAIEMFVYRILKYIGSYIMILQEIDAIILTGGIGENSQLIKEKIEEKIKKFHLKVLQIKTNEELQIAKEVKQMVTRRGNSHSTFL